MSFASPLPTVVILFADALAAPEVLWSLTEAGFDVLAVARRGSRTPLSFSRHGRIATVQDPAVSARQCLEELTALLGKFRDPIVMPLDDLAIWIVHQLESTLNLLVCGPTGDNATLTLDKRLQLQAARQAGLNVPPTTEVTLGGASARTDGLPWIVKPALAARLQGDRLGRGRALVLGGGTRLEQEAIGKTQSEPLIGQPHIRGTGEGVFGLALPGRIVAWSGHRRVRMMNPSGSGSSACVNVVPDPVTIQAIERFLLAIEWRGMFMVELLRDIDGTLWFMELNGRPWGSMALARRIGAEYPAWAVRAMLDPNYSPGPLQAAPTVLCRHLGREVLHLAFAIRGRGADDRVTPWPTPAGALVSMLDFSGRQALYNWCFSDPLVLPADFALTLQTVFRRKKPGTIAATGMWAKVRKRWAARAELKSQKALQVSGIPPEILKNAKSVLFICYGNINRSAVAERHFIQLTGNGCAVNSCGFHSEEQRPADPRMVAVAGQAGIDLANWSSRKISVELVDSADVIFAMEAKHLTQLYSDYPTTRGRAFLLGTLLSPDRGPIEIRDPFGHSRNIYEQCFGEVVAATSRLAGHLAMSRSVSVEAY